MAKKATNPIAGLWENLVGSRVRIMWAPSGWDIERTSVPGEFDTDQDREILKVWFRTAWSGKIRPDLELEGVPGKLFSIDEVRITEICGNNE